MSSTVTPTYSARSSNSTCTRVCCAARRRCGELLDETVEHRRTRPGRVRQPAVERDRLARRQATAVMVRPASSLCAAPGPTAPAPRAHPTASAAKTASCSSWFPAWAAIICGRSAACRRLDRDNATGGGKVAMNCATRENAVDPQPRLQRRTLQSPPGRGASPCPMTPWCWKTKTRAASSPLTLNRPAAFNALSEAMLAALQAAARPRGRRPGRACRRARRRGQGLLRRARSEGDARRAVAGLLRAPVRAVRAHDADASSACPYR